MKPTNKQVGLLEHLVSREQKESSLKQCFKEVKGMRVNETRYQFSKWVEENLDSYAVSTLITSFDEGVMTNTSFEELLNQFGYNHEACNGCGSDHDPENCTTGVNSPLL